MKTTYSIMLKALKKVDITKLPKRQALSCGTLFLMASASHINVPVIDTEIIAPYNSGLTHDQLADMRDDFGKQLTMLQNGLFAWSYTPHAVFSASAKFTHNCSDRDIALFPFALGLEHITLDELMKIVSIDRINTRWNAIRSLIKDVHEVRYQFHLIVCKDLSITNTECGHAGYKQIESLIKSDKNYEIKYKQYVVDGLIISYLYEVGLLQ